jgi:hypothetical protein
VRQHPATLTAIKELSAMTIYLYKKTHNKTKLQYLGKTTRHNPHEYKGSGKYWTNHIKKHGYDVTTEILKECQTNEELKEWGLYYSNIWNIVDERDEDGKKTWANLRPETGDGGETFTGRKHSHKSIELIREAKQKMTLSESHKINISKARKGTSWGKHTEETKALCREFRHSEEFKTKLSNERRGLNNPAADKTLYHFVHDSGIEEVCTRHELMHKYNLPKSTLRQVINNFHYSNGWRLKQSSSTGPKTLEDTKEYMFVHTSGKIECCTRAELVSKYSLHKTAICMMITGKRKSHKGWRLLPTPY